MSHALSTSERKRTFHYGVHKYRWDKATNGDGVETEER